MGTAACTNPAAGRAWAYDSAVIGSAQQTYACSRCAEIALAWLGLHVGQPAQWTQLNRPSDAGSGLHGHVSDTGATAGADAAGTEAEAG